MVILFITYSGMVLCGEMGCGALYNVMQYIPMWFGVSQCGVLCDL